MRAYDDEAMEEASVAQARIWTGLVLNDSYKIDALIDQDAIAEIYDGTEISTGERVALKILLPEAAADVKMRVLFADEARALTRLSDPGVQRYRCCAEDPQSKLLYIVMNQIIEKLDRLERVSPENVKRASWALCAANIFKLAATVGGTCSKWIASFGGWVAGVTVRLAPNRSSAALAAIALLTAAVPWLFQTSLPPAEAGARIAALDKLLQPVFLLSVGQERTDKAPAFVPAPSVPAVPIVVSAEPARTTPAIETVADTDEQSVLPDGKVYGTENKNSRLTLRIHRKTKLAVMGRRDKLLLLRKLEPGDSYRAPNLPDLTVTTADAGAVEVMFNGTSLGFIGEDGKAAIHVPLKR
jgi:hypothetical protein